MLATPSRAGEPAQRKEPLSLPYQAEIFSLAFSPDSKTLAAAGHGGVCLWDTATGKGPRRFAGFKGTNYALAFAPSGKSLAVGHYKDYQTYEGVISLLDPASGRVQQRFTGHHESPKKVHFTPDGNTLASVGTDKTLRLWDVATGKERRRFQALTKSTDPFAFSPDGKLLVTRTVATPEIVLDRNDKIDLIHLWDIATGKEVRRFKIGFLGIHTCTFSPDSRLLALAADGDRVGLWDAATGKELRRFDSGRINRCIQGGCVAFSPDGRMLATAELASGLCLWEVVTGQLRLELPQPGDNRALTFSPDGRLLASGGTDKTVRVWTVFDATPATVLTPKQREDLWNDLADNDGAKAFWAVRTLAAAPGQLVPFLREHLRPVQAPAAGLVPQLIEDLESENFTARDRATRELERLEQLAAAELRQALDRKMTQEGRRRVEGLLRKLDETAAFGKRLQMLRALEALEQVATTEARQLLRSLAQGAPAAWLTREARASIDRLALRPSLPP